ncbi:RNA-binding transcriptional accessory protein, partial [[Eubacterium] rectale]|nr:RNA-binding transcriptional accessory protein [Agathobacter rectalis]
HPESYEAVEKLFAKLNMKTEQISEGPTSVFIKYYKKMAEEIGVGGSTLRDLIKELQKPGRDPRDEMPRPILRTDVLDMKDLKVG